MTIKATVCFLMLVWTDLISVAAQDQSYTYYQHQIWWSPAQTFCECFGTLARLDSQEEFEHFKTQINIPNGRCAWIGLASWNTQRQLRWVQIPPNYSSSFTSGPVFTDESFDNFIEGHPLSSSRTVYGTCIQSDYTWKTIPHKTKQNLICEVPICGPGKYYGQIDPTNVYCRAFYGKTRACVQCPGNKVKTVSGNSQSLCMDNVCDGTTNVPSSDRSSCLCNIGYFQDGDSCSLCPENRIKTSVGNGSCEERCDDEGTVPNAERTGCVCAAGYFGTGSTGCNLCTGNMTKPEVGDSATCDQICDEESSRPSTDRTMCGFGNQVEHQEQRTACLDLDG